MNDVEHPNGGQKADAGGPDSAAPRPARRPALLVLLVVMIFVECAMMAGASVFLGIELAVDVPLSYASAVAILVLSVAATVWLAVLGVQALRGLAWVRSAAVVWQIVQLAIGVSNLQGEYARPDIGWALIAPAAVALVLLFTPTVRSAMVRAAS